MTLFIEIDGPFQWKPWRFDSPVIVRFGWGCFAFGWLKVSFHDFAMSRYDWLDE